MSNVISCVCFLVALLMVAEMAASMPLVINTWPFTEATKTAWYVLNHQKRSAMDAVEAGCLRCEILQCDGTVGFGGSPDENGETTLDAMIMDGRTHRVGAVAVLKRIKSAISVARAVMKYTKHTMLAGEAATQFAKEMGFVEEDLHTPASRKMFQDWKTSNCQPNYRQNVSPDPSIACGPYTPFDVRSNRLKFETRATIDERNHDTIGMVAIDVNGDIAVGTSTNGLNHKVPGRVADSPIPGAGGYADNDVGGAAATGDGDIMLRFLPSYQTVESMRQGLSPREAAADAIARIVKVHPDFNGAIIAANKNGVVGAACHGFTNFKFSFYRSAFDDVEVVDVPCTT